MLSRLSASFDTIFDIFDSKNETPQKNLWLLQNSHKKLEYLFQQIRYWVKVGKLKPTMSTEASYMMFSKTQIDKTIRMSKKQVSYYRYYR